MTTSPDNGQLRKSAVSSLTELIQWAPALLLVLYVLGYIAANSHYSRYEPVKADLLSARYLSAGLLYVAFASVPAAFGYFGGRFTASFWREGNKRVVVKICLGYLGIAGAYSAVLSLNTLVDLGSRFLWFGVAYVFVMAAGWAMFVGVMGHNGNTPFRAGMIIGTAISMASIAYQFGTYVYPRVMPHYGGAAVRNGYVVLRPDARQDLQRSLAGEPLPLLDLDDHFLHLIACRAGSESNQPETIMVPLELVASIGVASSRDEFVAIPTYVRTHKCERPKPGGD